MKGIFPIDKFRTLQTPFYYYDTKVLFLRTLETGIRLLEKTMADAKAAGKNEISGKDAFTLYDTCLLYTSRCV